MMMLCNFIGAGFEGSGSTTATGGAKGELLPVTDADAGAAFVAISMGCGAGTGVVEAAITGVVTASTGFVVGAVADADAGAG